MCSFEISKNTSSTVNEAIACDLFSNDSVLTFYGMEMSAFCNLFAIQNAMMFNDAYDRNLIEFDSVVANFR